MFTKNCYMNIIITLFDVDTGEIISRISRNLVFNAECKTDTGFRLIHDWVASTLRGVRNPAFGHDKLELSLRFFETEVPQDLFVNDSRMKIEANNQCVPIRKK